MDINSSTLTHLSFGSQRSLSVMCRALIVLAFRIFPVIASPPDSRVAMNDIDTPFGVGDLWFRRAGCVDSANASSLGCFCTWKSRLYHRSRAGGHSSCLCVLLIELNPFSSRTTRIEKDSSLLLFLFCFWGWFQKHATLHRYAPIISAVIATMIASLKSDHIRFSFSSADSTELVDSPSSSISSVGFGDSGSDM